MSRGFVLISCLAGGVLVAAAVHAQSVTWQSADEAGQGQVPVMPVHQEPHHRQVFQYGPMRIIDLQIPPGDMSWFHTHESPVFYLTVADSQTRTQILGEEWARADAERVPEPQAAAHLQQAQLLPERLRLADLRLVRRVQAPRQHHPAARLHEPADRRDSARVCSAISATRSGPSRIGFTTTEPVCIGLWV